MDRGIRGLPRGWAACALTILALAALPLAAAESGPEPALPPLVTQVEVAPNPVLPSYRVTVYAVAVSGSGLPVRGVEFLVDSPFNATRHFMAPMDGAYDGTAESVVWFGDYFDFGAGWHTLYVHATEDRLTWGPFHSDTVFLAEHPSTYGPTVAALAVAADVPRGAPLTIQADLVDPFAQAPWNSSVEAAEFFVDAFTGDGNGTRLAGAYGGGQVAGTWSGVPVLSAGLHFVYVHARNSYGTWGPLAQAPFLVRTPSFLLSVLSDRETAVRGEAVVYTVNFTNAGNANATVWIDVALPETVRKEWDDAGAAGGSPTGPTSWEFSDVGPGARTFRIQARVVPDARDGAPLGAAATLDFTNALGWDYPPVSAGVGGSVIAPEIAVSLSGSGQGFAGETVTWTVVLAHTGLRPIPSVDVALGESPWLEVVGDTAQGSGGDPVGPGRWRFRDLAPGFYSFAVTERIRPEAPDALLIARALEVSYVSRFGTPVVLSEPATLSVSRPTFALRASASPREVAVGERLAVTLAFENVGSAGSKLVQVATTLPAEFALVGGDAPAASAGRDVHWEWRDVRPGAQTATLVLEAREDGVVELRFTLLYFSPNGAPLGLVEATVVLVANPAPPPVVATYAGFAATGALVAFAGFLATERGKTALLFLLVPLYTRLRHEKVLDHETRGMIRGYIVANPGDHYNSIKEALDLPNGTLAYHLQVLEKESLVRSVKDGKFRRFYPYEMRVPESGEPTRIQKHILDLIRANPGLTPRDAAGLLGLTSSTVSYHLERLLELEKIEVRREGIAKRLYVRGDLEA